LTGEGVGGVAMRVVVLEVDEEEEDMNLLCWLISFVSVFFYRL